METPAPFRIRAAEPHDVPALMRLKHLLAQGEDGAHILRASEADWLRDGFGRHPRFTAFLAEVSGGAAEGPVIGMATCSRRVVIGWNGPVVFMQDLFVEAAYRDQG